jgi:hypothetical protein
MWTSLIVILVLLSSTRTMITLSLWLSTTSWPLCPGSHYPHRIRSSTSIVKIRTIPSSWLGCLRHFISHSCGKEYVFWLLPGTVCKSSVANSLWNSKLPKLLDDFLFSIARKVWHLKLSYLSLSLGMYFNHQASKHGLKHWTCNLA